LKLGGEHTILATITRDVSF